MALLIFIYSLFCLLLLLLLYSPLSRADSLLTQRCEADGGNFTANSTFQSNLNILLTSLSSSNSTFSTDAKGSSPDTAFGLTQCRGDVSLSNCSSCLQNAAQNLPQLCPYYKQATIWYDYCQLRYSNLRFFSALDDTHKYALYNTQNATNWAVFNKSMTELVETLFSRAAYQSSTKFETGRIVYAKDSPAINGFAQCTRDVGADECRQCLQDMFGFFLQCCSGKVGGRVLGDSCNFRYEVYSLFQGQPNVSLGLPSPPPPPPPPSPPSPSLTPPATEGKKSNTGKILAIVIPLAVGLVLIITFFACFWRRRSARREHDMDNLEEIARESLLFNLSTLKVATSNFSEAKKLGQGGFGAVYKGILPSGQEIAVKRLSTGSKQGLGELKNELLLVAKLQHKNLVRLRGVCVEEDENLLVYEYLPNRSLDTYLFDPIKCKLLNWERRFNIIRGIARGILYLHEESHLKVIHRDLKPSNVLLDTDMNPKISDFGLARLFGGDETQGMTSRVVGTFGYMPPEYAMRGQLSTKVDVFSFGVIVLEIVTGRKSNSFSDAGGGKDLLGYAWEHWSNGTVLEIIDPCLGEEFSRNEVLRCIHIGLLCAQEFPSHRPLMSTAVLMLGSPSVALGDPLQPTFCLPMSVTNSNVSSKPSVASSSNSTASSSTAKSVNEVSITELVPR